jgi:hypothetical protein
MKKEDVEIRENFKFISDLLIANVNDFIKKHPLTMTSSHPLSHKTISEIGGRILEEYISKAIKESFSKNSDYFVNYLSSRSLGDFFVQSKKVLQRFTLISNRNICQLEKKRMNIISIIIFNKKSPARAILI